MIFIFNLVFFFSEVLDLTDELFDEVGSALSKTL